jgi:nicotinate dehydrogenase subunit B
METAFASARRTRREVLKGGALTIGFVFAAAPGSPLLKRAAAQTGASVARTLDPKEVDAFLAIGADGIVTVYCGKVDLGQGLRIAIRQIAAEELGIGVDKIELIEGDTALTPDQGRTSGSNGIQRGGMQIRQAAATARKALIELAARRLNSKGEDLVVIDGAVRPKVGGDGISFAELIGTRRFDLKLDPKAPLKDPADYTLVGQSLPRPDVPAKCTGIHIYMHDFTVPGMVHARVIRPPAVGASLNLVDESSIKDFAGARVVRVNDLLAVVAEDEWTAVSAARALRTQWSSGAGLPAQDGLAAALRKDPSITDQVLINKGAAGSRSPEAKALAATYFWPMQSHASIGPSCAVADVSADAATVWTASQGTHGNRDAFARFLGLTRDKVRLIYLDGSGCYGMNGHEDAAADAAILSRAVARPVRVQWSREDEHGWDPKGPPQLLDISGVVDGAGRILEWRTEMWLPQTTQGLPNVPLLAPEAAGLEQMRGFNAGLISQNGDPPYAADQVQVIVHWLKDAPLRAAPIRSPGKPANCFAVESFVDELVPQRAWIPLNFGFAVSKTRAASRSSGAWRQPCNGSPDPLPKATCVRHSPVAVAWRMSTTSMPRPTWRWVWRSSSTGRKAASRSKRWCAPTIVGKSSTPTACGRRLKAASCRRSVAS